MPRRYGLLLLLLTPTPVAAQTGLPVIEALQSDFGLTQLPPGTSGRATISVTSSPGTDALTCKATSVKGGAAIGRASCNLILMKWGWLPNMKDKDGNDLTIPKVIVQWPTIKRLKKITISDFGDANPISPSQWVTDLDYPRAALRKRSQGRTGFSIDISAFGLVTGCTITSSSGDTELDSKACDLIVERGRFLPALDANKRPVATTGKSAVFWRLPI